MADATYTITELAREFGLTTRKSSVFSRCCGNAAAFWSSNAKIIEVVLGEIAAFEEQCRKFLDGNDKASPRESKVVGKERSND